MAVFIAFLVTAGWWVLRAPFVQKAMASPPDVAIDLPRMQPEGEVAAGVTRTDPAKPVKSPATAASGALGAVERCGDDQRPRYGEIPKGPFRVWVQTEPGGLGYAAAQARIDAALRASADPFDRAVSDMLNVGDIRTPAGALDALVQDALTSSDPRIYSLAMHACVDADARSGFPVNAPPPPPSCQSLSAQQWARIDPGNGVPWSVVYGQASSTGDAAAKADALAHLVAATRFDDRPNIAAAAVLRNAPPYPTDAAASDDLAQRGLWLNHFASMPASDCKSALGHDAALTAQCTAIATTMFEHSDSIDLRNRGAWLTVYATGDSSRRVVSHAEFERATARAKALETTSQCSQVRAQMKEILRDAQIGEVEAMREAASASAVP